VTLSDRDVTIPGMDKPVANTIDLAVQNQRQREAEQLASRIVDQLDECLQRIPREWRYQTAPDPSWSWVTLCRP
jgi:hypothetical protein